MGEGIYLAAMPETSSDFRKAPDYLRAKELATHLLAHEPWAYFSLQIQAFRANDTLKQEFPDTKWDIHPFAPPGELLGISLQNSQYKYIEHLEKNPGKKVEGGDARLNFFMGSLGNSLLGSISPERREIRQVLQNLVNVYGEGPQNPKAFQASAAQATQLLRARLDDPTLLVEPTVRFSEEEPVLQGFQATWSGGKASLQISLMQASPESREVELLGRTIPQAQVTDASYHLMEAVQGIRLLLKAPLSGDAHMALASLIELLNDRVGSSDACIAYTPFPMQGYHLVTEPFLLRKVQGEAWTLQHFQVPKFTDEEREERRVRFEAEAAEMRLAQPWIQREREAMSSAPDMLPAEEQPSDTPSPDGQPELVDLPAPEEGLVNLLEALPNARGGG